MPARRVLIEHKDGRRYSVTPADFRKLYQDQGFKIASNEDGTEYEEPRREAARAEKAEDKKDGG